VRTQAGVSHGALLHGVVVPVTAEPTPIAGPSEDDRCVDPMVGSLVGGRYRVTSVIGRGGMGIVYEAVHAELERPVALKVLGPAWASDEPAIARFQREARTASNLGHPNIVTIYDFGRLEDGRPYIAMERLRGECLAAVLARESSFSPERAARVVRQVAEALDAVHAQGVVHRDVKPENIVLGRSPGGHECAHLLDFGLAAFSAPGDEQRRLTGQGQVQGTPLYIAPEVATGEVPADLRADIYSLGVVAFEMLSGVLPFDRENPMQLLLQKCNEAAPSMSKASGRAFPRELEDVVARALQRHPDMRPESAGEFAREFWRAACPGVPFGVDSVAPQATHPGDAVPLSTKPAALDPDPESVELPISRAPRLVTIALLFATAAAGATALGTARRSQTPEDRATRPRESDVGGGRAASAPPQADESARPQHHEGASGGDVGGAVAVDGTDSVRAMQSAQAVAERTEEKPASESRIDDVAAGAAPSRRASPALAEPSRSAERLPSVAAPADVDSAAELTRLGTAALVAGQFQQAVTHFQDATRAASRHAPAWRGLGFAHERLGQQASARRAYRRYLQLAPRAADADSVRTRLEALSAN
jgi:eukaryotic-like serine/threonine-protein kinase